MRVIIVGAESTGKTTLAKALAKRLNTKCALEYGRFLTESKSATGTEVEWLPEDFDHIARMQDALEDHLARQANKVLIADTNSFATRIWMERYLGKKMPLSDELNLHQQPLYAVTPASTPFVQDGLRDGKHVREWMEERFIEELVLHNLDFVTVEGNVEERATKVLQHIDSRFSRRRS